MKIIGGLSLLVVAQINVSQENIVLSSWLVNVKLIYSGITGPGTDSHFFPSVEKRLFCLKSMILKHES
jgi:hypothetical protein